LVNLMAMYCSVVQYCCFPFVLREVSIEGDPL